MQPTRARPPAADKRQGLCPADIGVPRLSGQIVICHGGFDCRALEAACARIGEGSLPAAWLDSIEIARQAWPQFGRYDLKIILCAHLMIPLESHHDALSDARAAAEIVRRALEESGASLRDWVVMPPAGHRDAFSAVGHGARASALR